MKLKTTDSPSSRPRNSKLDIQALRAGAKRKKAAAGADNSSRSRHEINEAPRIKRKRKK